MSKRRLLIVGCGRLGIQLAGLLRNDYVVYGLRRTPSRLPGFIRGIEADVTRQHTTMSVLADRQFDYVLLSLSAGRYSEEAYRQTYTDALSRILQALHHCAVKRMFFISSTRVYGTDSGTWLDESDEAIPGDFAGRHVLAGERLLAVSRIPSTVLRLSGLYGPQHGRLLKLLRHGELKLPGDDIYTNRIHCHDAAGFVAHLMLAQDANQLIEPLYIVSDSAPTRYGLVISWLAEQLGVTVPGRAPSGTRAGRKRYNRRFRNRRMLASGYRLRYPNYRSGYGAILDQFGTDHWSR